MKSTATILTHNGRRYMGQLCRHFAHRVPATFDEREGEIVFGAGKVGLRAAPATFMLWACADEPSSLQRLEQVIESHLKRFAFHEADLAVEWRRAPAA